VTDALSPKWNEQRLDTLLKRSRGSLARLSSFEIREMALLYRRLIHTLSRLRGRGDDRPTEMRLNHLAQRAHAWLYATSPVSWRDIWRYFTVRFPRCFRKNSGWIALAALLFTLGALVALATVALDPSTEAYFLPPSTIENLDKGVLWTDGMRPHASESSFLMSNNIRVAMNAFAVGSFFGIGTLVVLFQNGLYALGGPLAVCFRHGMGMRLLSFIAAHGIIELLTVFIAGGAGMLIGFTALFPGNRPRWEAVRQTASEAFVLIMGCLPLLAIAGLIEGMVSLNRQVPLPIRLLIAGLSAVFLVLYLGFCGARNSKTAISGRVLNRKRGNPMRCFFK
jgi:uncharacterized membrane protein SpoIIM required for sporulation